MEPEATTTFKQEIHLSVEKTPLLTGYTGNIPFAQAPQINLHIKVNVGGFFRSSPDPNHLHDLGFQPAFRGGFQSG